MPLSEEPRFLTPADVAEVLATSVSQVVALIRAGELAHMRLGGRGQYRIEVSDLEDYIARQKQRAREDVERRRRERTERNETEGSDQADGDVPEPDR